MAFVKNANAMVVHPRVSSNQWSGIRRTASKGASSRNLTDQARAILGGNLDPDKFLFTHCTIVASVDVEAAPDVKLGKVRLASGAVINRKYSDYLVQPKSAQFVNNNGDCWSREVLALSFPTFVGGHNFQEHVQVEAKSKGRIIDAVSRDIGDSLYVDILVATERKHTTLVNDIKSGRMATLSMGCTTDFTLCTKCGHLAVDETELCDHIKLSKLNTFIDSRGTQRVVAELCGHAKYAENPSAPGGVKFIEASWVASPAFPGAVMRNIFSLDEGRGLQGSVHSELVRTSSSWSKSAIKKAASQVIAEESEEESEGTPEEESTEAEPAESKTPKAPKKPFEDLEQEVYDSVKKDVKDRLRSEMTDVSQPSDAANDSIIREASASRIAAETKIVRTATCDASLVERVARLYAKQGMNVKVDCYRAALWAGPLSRHASEGSYLTSCKRHAGRNFSEFESRVVSRVGNLLSHWEGSPPSGVAK